MRHLWVALMVASIIGSTPRQARGQNSVLERIDSLAVLVSIRIRPDGLVGGRDETAWSSRLQTVVELSLRSAGVRAGGNPGEVYPLLFLNGVLLHDGGAFVHSLELSVRDWGTLPRVPNGEPTPLEIWSRMRAGLTDDAGITDMLETNTRELVETFLNDYLAANPNRR